MYLTKSSTLQIGDLFCVTPNSIVAWTLKEYWKIFRNLTKMLHGR